MSDVMQGQCEKATWRDDGTCSWCGSHRPSKALELIRGGATVTPTDKSWKIYVSDLPDGGKCYTNHFSEAQAVEFVVLNETGKMKLATPGHFYSGLAFGGYKDAITKAVDALKGAA